MLPRIDLFMPPASHSGMLGHFTQQMHAALLSLGVTTRLLEANYRQPAKFIEQILSSPPDCTLSFNGLLPDAKGHFFCDLIKIPHVACLADSPHRFMELIRSKRNLITCCDRFACQFFRSDTGQSNALFLTHAAAMSPVESAVEKEYDVVLFASAVDYEAMRRAWVEKYPTVVHWSLHEAAEEALREPNRSYVEIFAEAFDRQLRPVGGVNPKEIDLVAALQDLEDYLNSKDRIELVKAIEGPRVHIFGQMHDGSWQTYLGKQRNVVVHEEISFNEMLQVMQRSRLVLNSCPSQRLGGHMRVFEGLRQGAAVLSSGSAYLNETFTHGKDIMFYRYGDHTGINSSIEALLKDEGRRQALVADGQQVVQHHHTWLQRAQELLRHLPHKLANLT